MISGMSLSSIGTKIVAITVKLIFTSAKVAVDYATKLSNDFRSSYEADHYEIKETSGGGCGWRLETYTEIKATYHNSEDVVACELYKIGKVELTREGE